MKVHIDAARCEGHGRCYSIAPELFGPDDIGNGQVIGDGSVSAEQVGVARSAVDNCPEQAVTFEEENPDG
jgi:ferredoxin